VVRVIIQRLSDKRGSRGPERRGVMLAWPEAGASILIVLADRREMKTSIVERVLAAGEDAIFARTRNSTYRVACEPGDEPAWHRMRGGPVPISIAGADETSPEWVQQSGGSSSDESSSGGRKR
jgi:hypothetical protein